tara:strand:- start:204 stop:731 length:528 start_codon:yes stop_codon:yes gene_type:complete
MMTEGDLRWIENWQPQQIGNNMNKFYRKPKPETMKKNRESYSEIFKQEISWLKDNLQTLTESKNKFLIDMYTILITGSRKITPKMASAIKNGIEKCKNSPLYNPELQAEAEAKLKPILEKIVMVERLAEKKNDKAQTFVRSVKQYVQMNYRITKKQMEGLNKVYKRCSEDLFKKD